METGEVGAGVGLRVQDREERREEEPVRRHHPPAGGGGSRGGITGHGVGRNGRRAWGAQCVGVALWSGAHPSSTPGTTEGLGVLLCSPYI